MKRIITRPRTPAILVMACGTIALAGCGGSSGGSSAQAGFTLRAQIIGFESSGLSLQGPGVGPSTPVPRGATTAVLATSLRAGTFYTVTVGNQPVGENCAPTGANASGTLSGNVDVTIMCFPQSTAVVLYSFAGGSDGAGPFGALIQGSDGNLYGTTFQGGSYGQGTVFKVTSGGSETIIYSFTGGSDGANPYSGLVQARDGNFYGTAGSGVTGEGTVFKVTPAGSETALYSFPGRYAGSVSGLIQASDGNFYGTTMHDGASTCGTAFRITPAGVESTLYSFTGDSDGCNPESGLIQASDGNFYGTTFEGGTTNGGTVFKITPAGIESILYSFSGGSDGCGPEASVIQASDGNFYGTTLRCGANDYGTVFEVTAAGVESVLHSFTGIADGETPTTGVIQAANGNFYGITPGCCSGFGVSPPPYGAGGVFFTISPTGAFAVLYSLNLDGSQGEILETVPPTNGLMQASNGNFYFTVSNSSAQSNEGTIIQVNPLQ